MEEEPDLHLRAGQERSTLMTNNTIVIRYAQAAIREPMHVASGQVPSLITVTSSLIHTFLIHILSILLSNLSQSARPPSQRSTAARLHTLI